MVDQIWQQQLGEGPLVATAIHNGHAVRDELLAHLSLDESARLREEDPFTCQWTSIAPTQVIGTRSRFEVDVNRPRDKAIYRTPDDAWGLTVWKDGTPDRLFETSLAEYDLFYRSMRELVKGIARGYGRFIVLDLHTYNHRRDGANGQAANPAHNPQVNVGTGTMNRQRWRPVVETFIEKLSAFDFPGGRLDVRENVKFRGGNWPRWIHEHFPDTGVALAVEVKKFFMDEWTGQPNDELVKAIGDALRFALPAVMSAFKRV